MKKLIILICIGLCFSGCNLGEINIVGHKRHKDKLPDFIINIDNHIIYDDRIEVFTHVQNIGGFNFSGDYTLIIVHINDGVVKGFFAVNDLTNRNFFSKIVIHTNIECESIFATIDKPIIQGGVIREGFIIESNEGNNLSNIIDCIN